MEMVYFHMTGLLICVMIFRQKIKVVVFLCFSIMVKNIIMLKINLDYKVLMNKSLLIWKKWWPKCVEFNKVVKNTLRISQIVLLEKVVSWKINILEVDFNRIQDQVHLQGWCREEETWKLYMEMKRIYTL